MNINDEHKRKIESTKFIFCAAKSGVGKSFFGDYLEAIRGWKHVDGDIPYKHADSSPAYMDMVDQWAGRGEYAEKSKEWKLNEGWKPLVKELTRLTLEAAKESDKVVLTWIAFSPSQRLFVRQQLVDAGAKDVSMVFLECDVDAHMKAAWARSLKQAEQAGTTVEILLKENYHFPGIVDFEAFVEFHKLFDVLFAKPHDSEKPFKVVNNTAKDMTVLDKYDMVAGIQDEDRGNLSYDELIEIIKKVDVKRDKEWIDSKAKSSEEKEFAEKEPEKYAARRSSLLEADKLIAIHRLSSPSNTRDSQSSTSSRRQSFLLTGNFE